MATADTEGFVGTVGLGLLGIDKTELDAAAGDSDERRRLAIAGICGIGAFVGGL